MDYLNEVRKNLGLPPAQKEQVMEEVEQHYTATLAELRDEGMNESVAEAEARKRLGEPQHIASCFQAVHGGATWQQSLMAAAPIIGWVFFAMWVHPASAPVFGIGFLGFAAVWIAVTVGAGRELIAGRRPVWLPTWLAASLVMTFVITFQPWQHARSKHYVDPVVYMLLFTAVPILTALGVFTLRRATASAWLFLFTFYSLLMLLVPLQSMDTAAVIAYGQVISIGPSHALYAVSLFAAIAMQAASAALLIRTTSHKQQISLVFIGYVATEATLLLGQATAGSVAFTENVFNQLHLIAGLLLVYAALLSLWTLGIPALCARIIAGRRPIAAK